jgi:hypothetical protein
MWYLSVEQGQTELDRPVMNAMPRKTLSRWLLCIKYRLHILRMCIHFYLSANGDGYRSKSDLWGLVPSDIEPCDAECQVEAGYFMML